MRIVKSFILVMILIMSACNKSDNKKQNIESYKLKIKKLIFETPKIKNDLINFFDINNLESPKTFKILISRRNHFVRITIYQIFYKSELEELPSGVIEYNKSLFFYYNSSELISGDYIQKRELEKIISESKIKLIKSFSKIIDSRIFQFDVYINNKMKINYPPLNPYDENEEIIHFK